MLRATVWPKEWSIEAAKAMALAEVFEPQEIFTSCTLGRCKMNQQMQPIGIERIGLEMEPGQEQAVRMTLESPTRLRGRWEFRTSWKTEERPRRRA
jgi:hypothetical protein